VTDPIQNGNGTERMIARAAQSATLTVTARICIVLLAVVFVPLGTFFLKQVWTDFVEMKESVAAIKREQGYTNLRLGGIERELKIEPPPPWWDRRSHDVPLPPPPPPAPTAPTSIGNRSDTT
jgi:hypothetical protein